MIKVQTLRLHGLCASSLLALAACTGAPSNTADLQSAPSGTTPPATDPATPPGDVSAAQPAKPEPTAQEPKPQEPRPQEPRSREAIVRKAVENARRSLDLRLFEDARNEAAYALEL